MMKKLLLMIAFCAFTLSSFASAEIDKINALVKEATKKTLAAKSAQEVGAIAQTLTEQMDKITAESGDKPTGGKNADAALAEYEKAVMAKFKEYGIEMQ